MNNKLTSNYIPFLNPHAKILYDEIIIAFKNKMWASVIILSLTIIDNVIMDERSLNYIDGLDLNDFKRSKNLKWLRIRRNQILHYEGPIEGFYGSNDSKNALKEDSKKAIKIMDVGLEKLFIRTSNFI
ncbi:MAG: hypothetical protein ACKVIT_09105 [Candidatus Puniceispirillales bacterium]|jgi:hypothetical protein|tara:strand:+ start:921 stop:1304 length:384 start_codon:yes stop_codon:yes gene_type:complete